MSPAVQLLNQVWLYGKKDSWGRINHSMRNALSLAIGSGMEFHADDFRTILNDFRAGYWIGSCDEWVYTMAIFIGNKSCIKAYEMYADRKPFIHTNVNLGWHATGEGYIHANHSTRAKERLAVGFSFKFAGRVWYVTSFKDDTGHIVMASYKGNNREGAPEKIMKATHEQMKAMR